LADRPGLRELGEENRGARVLPEQDLLAWAHAIEAWLRAPEECLQAGAAARRVAEERHALAARGRELAVCYTTLLGLRSRP